MRRRYGEPDEGEWIVPVRNGWRDACCDCGAVHEVDFRVAPHGRGHRVMLRFRNHSSATAAMRRHMRARAGS